MKRGEVKELAGMFGILAAVMVMGSGVSSLAHESPEVAEVPEVPAVESPAATGAHQATGPAGSADSPPIPRLEASPDV